MSGSKREGVLAKYAGTEVPVVCPFCHSDDAEPILCHERYGTGLPTVLCRRCCLIYLGRRWPNGVYRRFYNADYRLVDEIQGTVAERYAEQLVKSGTLIAFCGPYLPDHDAAALDVGASAGGVVQGLRWATGCRAVGIDPSREESEFARSRGIDVRTGTLESVELEPASFDLALLVGTIDHLLDPFGDLQRIRSLLKPTGALYATRRLHEPPPVARRILRRLGALDDGSSSPSSHP